MNHQGTLGGHEARPYRGTTIAAAILLACAAALCRADIDRFGGDASVSLEARGFFRVEKVKGFWWMVDPEGHPFYCTGVNHVVPEGYRSKVTHESAYAQTVADRYGSTEHWAAATRDRLRDWGFNTLGSWARRELIPDFPYTLDVDIAGAAGADWGKGTFPDVFTDDFHEKALQRAKERCASHAQDPWLVGYCTDNELAWGPDWRVLTSLATRYAALPEDSPGRRAWLDFARGHGRRAEFAGIVAERYFSVCEEAIRAADPHHLILGCRFHAGGAPEPVVRACGRHCDVVSVNFYSMGGLLDAGVTRVLGNLPTDDWLKRYHEVSGRPILVTEFSFKAMDTGHPNTWGAGLPVLTQRDRARGFLRYARRCLTSPWVVGYHWFAWVDEPKEGCEGSGENCNFGLVNDRDEPYPALVSSMRRIHSAMYEIRGTAADGFR